mgnify:CR=1 FL=1
MKYHESTFEEYIKSVNRLNLHPELESLTNKFPHTLPEFKNILLYGPSGVGKYSQALKIISKYSTNNLKYDKRIGIITDKLEKKKCKTDTVKINAESSSKTLTLPSKPQEFSFRISDLHYEVDMSLLGCNSKTLWHDIFFQIIDIVSLKKEKIGIIICKNFHHVYNELLDVFYSYMKHPLHRYNIQLHFVLITEHISFIPQDIIDNCQCIPVKRPSLELYESCIERIPKNLSSISAKNIINAKELHNLKRVYDIDKCPKELFDIVNDNILFYLLNPEAIDVKTFRNHLYDILIFNIDVTESFSHILFYCITNDLFVSKSDITLVISNFFVQLKYFNNNYRSIYHLENLFFYILNKIHYSKYT